ncbi:hypothetical protein KCU61_g130, partial [Aureobasidium melanogenum]
LILSAKKPTTDFLTLGSASKISRPIASMSSGSSRPPSLRSSSNSTAAARTLDSASLVAISTIRPLKRSVKALRPPSLFLSAYSRCLPLKNNRRECEDLLLHGAIELFLICLCLLGVVLQLADSAFEASSANSLPTSQRAVMMVRETTVAVCLKVRGWRKGRWCESLKAAVPLPFAIMGYSETFCYKAIAEPASTVVRPADLNTKLTKSVKAPDSCSLNAASHPSAASSSVLPRAKTSAVVQTSSTPLAFFERPFLAPALTGNATEVPFVFERFAAGFFGAAAFALRALAFCSRSSSSPGSLSSSSSDSSSSSSWSSSAASRLRLEAAGASSICIRSLFMSLRQDVKDGDERSFPSSRVSRWSGSLVTRAEAADDATTLSVFVELDIRKSFQGNISSRSGLVVKFVLAMHEPRVRFTAATLFCLLRAYNVFYSSNLVRPIATVSDV